MLSKPKDRYEWAYAAVNITQAATSLALQIACLVVFQTHLEGIPINSVYSLFYVPTAFLTYLILVYFYQLVLVYDTIDKRNAFQAIGLIALNVFISSYIGVSLNQFRDDILTLAEDDLMGKDVWVTSRHLMIANLTVVALSTIGNLGFVYIMHSKPFEGMIRRRKAVAIEPRTLYSSYLAMITLLRFELIFNIGFAVQNITLQAKTLQAKTLTRAEVLLSLILIPLTLVSIILAQTCVRIESNKGMVISVALHLSMIAYFIFMQVCLFSPDYKGLYHPMRHLLELYLVICTLLGVCSIVFLTICWKHFNRGLNVFLTAPAVAFELAKKHSPVLVESLENDQRYDALLSDRIPGFASKGHPVQTA